MPDRHTGLCARLLGGTALVAFAGAAHAQDAQFNISPQPLSSALHAFSEQADSAVIFKPDLADAKTSGGVTGAAEIQNALNQVLEGTGLAYQRDGDTFVIVQASTFPRLSKPFPQFQSADGGALLNAVDIAPRRQMVEETLSGSAVEGLVVTAQKRREQIQDVPIAISAFNADALQAQKIEGGFDLLKAIPNVTFSKNNFSSYNFSIRGIGTKAISVTTDPGVAVEFNNVALIRNRLFEQEYFDIERVEVLRGPQGTLHGRNATAGVINVISSDAALDAFDGSLKGEVGNYHTKRLSGFVNVPLIEDVLALRFAGALTSREGYDYNSRTQHRINGRDLWSGRLSIGFEPTEAIRADFVWERFNEDDDRSRTGKQLCHRDPGPQDVGAQLNLTPLARGQLSQGCKPGSLYDADAFGTPNGLSIPFMWYGSVGQDYSSIGFDAPPSTFDGAANTFENFRHRVAALKRVDPYGGLMQNTDLRVIDSVRDPLYRANADIFELNVDFDLSPSLTLTSQTAYAEDEVYSFQDYNRFNTKPIFNDTSNLWDSVNFAGCPDALCGGQVDTPSHFRGLAPGGIYCDPQIGCADSVAGFDISQAKSQQFSQELRVSSDFSGPLNFAAGANYTDYRTLENYYVMYNLITFLSQLNGILQTFNNTTDVTKCGNPGIPQGSPVYPAVDIDSPEAVGCIYIDPNPVESINGDGHNYFRSKNPYRLKSWAAFGEMYWQATEALKVTAGLRYTDDRKVFTPVPSQLLLSTKYLLGGTVDRGYPSDPDIIQHWGEVTGRFGVDWKPDLAFTDDTMIYAFYSRGYKGGGANPPGIGFDKAAKICNFGPECVPVVRTFPYPKTFEPEFVDAFEIGAKNTLFGGALTANGTVFYYDYQNYQVSAIKDRTAVNENFDAKVWGLELETLFAPSENLRFNASLGYQDTQIADGAESIDLMDRIQDHDDEYMIMKPWVQGPSNCVMPRTVVEGIVEYARGAQEAFSPDDLELAQYIYDDSMAMGFLCPGTWYGDAVGPSFFDFIGVDHDAYLAATNGGQGFMKDVGGNELPNAPHWTVSLGGQYGWDILDGNWHVTARADAYWQSQSWARVYNDNPYDKLHGWYNANLSFWVEKPEEDLKIEFYIKNLLDDTPITDAFLNSDDTALTTNVFTLDPRLIGLQITKGF